MRERDSTIELIQSMGFNYVSRGKGKKELLNLVIVRKLVSFSEFSNNVNKQKMLSFAKEMDKYGPQRQFGFWGFWAWDF